MSTSTIDLANFTSGFVIQGATLNSYLGNSVKYAGDINNDGYSDIVVGAFLASPNSRSYAGEGYVLFGKSSGFSIIDLANFTSGTSGFIIQGAAADDQSSYSVSSAGDVNGDSYDDIIIGAHQADLNSRSNAGAAYVLFGKASGFSTIDLASFTSGTSGFIIQGAVAGDRAGYLVSELGDVNADGYADVIIGAPNADPNSRSDAGTTYVIFGKASGFSTIDLASFTSGTSGFIIQGAVAGDNLGWSVSQAGDVNADGYDDIIIGAPNADPNSRTNAGAAYVIFGKASGFSTIDLASFSSGSSGFIIQGAVAVDALGWSVNQAGDVNGDGYGDIVAGAVGADPNSLNRAGAAYVIFGKASGFNTIDLASFSSGSSGFIIQGAEISNELGYSVSSAGDVNNDGYSDVIVGAPLFDSASSNRAGTAYVIYGKAKGFSTIDLASFSSGVKGYIIKGAAAVDELGYSVSGAGDVNNDGCDDIIVGARQANSNSLTDSGAAYVIINSEDCPVALVSEGIILDLANFNSSDSNGYILQGGTSPGQLGWSVGQAGDVNGDGYDDVIVGAPFESPNSRTYSGSVYVIFGKENGFSSIDLTGFISGSNGFIIQGAAADDSLGVAVNGAGDVNGDGYDDIIISAGYADPNSRESAGVVYVIFGKASGFSTINLSSFSSGTSGFIIQGAATGYAIGLYSVSGAGDINGDGYDDVILGSYTSSPNSRNGAGTAYVVFGKASSFSTIDLASFSSGTSGFIIQGAAYSDALGLWVSKAGDVNGDGYGDIVVGAHTVSPNLYTYAGAAYVIFGKASSFSTIDLASFSSGTSGFIILGNAVNNYFGRSVSEAGDVNGDGYDDIVIGATGADPNSRSDAGATYVIFGKASSFSTIDLASFSSGSSGFIIQGAAAGDTLGSSVSAAGDINNDKYDDIIIDARFADPNSRDGAGAAYIIFGKASGFSTIDLANFNTSIGSVIQGAVAGDALGWSVSGAGDINNDGYSDVVIGARLADPNSVTNGGASYVIFGSALLSAPTPAPTTIAPTTAAPTISPTTTPTTIAPTTAAPTTAAPTTVAPTTAAPTVMTTIDLANFSSGSSGLIIQGSAAGDQLGWSVSGAGDFNNDGYDDVIVGALAASPNSRTTAGEAYVIFGKASGFNTIDLANFTSGANGLIIQGAAGEDQLGRSVSGAGDFNGDGYDDIIIGAIGADYNSRTIAGVAYVIFGKASSFSTIDLASFSSGSNGFIIQGAAAFDCLGYSVSETGDFNNDGYDDIIVGAYMASPNSRSDAGAAYVIFGKASGFSTIDLASFSSGTSGFIIQGAITGDQLGWSVNGAGDFNGDGYDDIIIGAPGERAVTSYGRTTFPGAAYVIFGKASGFSTIDLASFSSGSSGFIIQGAAAGDQLGRAVSGIGDFNGDGYDDIIVETPFADPNSRSNAGTVYVIFGKASGFSTIDLASFTSGSNGFIIQGAAAGDVLGGGSGSVDGNIGDINNDGYDDIIVAAYAADANSRSDSGASYIIFGKASSFSTIDLASFTSGSNGFIIQGAAASDYSGVSVSRVGDINGDGGIDIIIGAYGVDANSRSDSGASYVIFGTPVATPAPTTVAPTTVAPTIAPTVSPTVMPTVMNTTTPTVTPTVAPTTNTTAPTVTPTAAPTTAMPTVANTTAPTTNTTAPTVTPTAAPTTIAPTTAMPTVVNTTAPTTNTTAPTVTPTASPTTAMPTVVNTTAPTVNTTVLTATPTVLLTTISITDIDLASFNVGSSGFAIQGSAVGDYLGYSVSGAGDFNGDGYSDIIISAPYQYSNDAGAMYIIFGKANEFANIDLSNFTSGDDGFRVKGVAWSQSGWSVSEAGDVNGDGYGDVIIGAPYKDYQDGESYVVFGKTNGFSDIDLSNSTHLAKFTNGTSGFIIKGGDYTGDYAGWSVSKVGDFNGDGYDDIIIGVYEADFNSRSNSGAAFVIFGKANGFSTINLSTFSSGTGGFIIQGAATGDRAGYSVSGAGDVNNDGYDDIIIGVPYRYNTDTGAAYVIFGKASGFSTIDLASFSSGANGFIIQGAADWGSLGWSVSGAGDVNNDNYDDVVVGAYSEDSNLRGDAGAVYVIFGKATGFSVINIASVINGTDGYAIQGAAAGDRIGYSVGNAGDVNADGYDDIIIGAPDADPNARDGAGLSYVIYGKANGFSTLDLANFNNITDGFIIKGAVAADRAGYAVSGAGDFNGDGFDDIIIGAYQADPNARSNAGVGYVILNCVGCEIPPTAAPTPMPITMAPTTATPTISPTATPTASPTAAPVVNLCPEGQVILGDPGNNTFKANSCVNYYDGLGGINTVDYSNSAQAVEVNLTEGAGYDGDAEGDEYFSIQNIIGSDYGDKIIGNAENNVIEGRGGDDVIEDQGGRNDEFIGGKGDDIFVISTAAGMVTIYDFKRPGNDKIDLSNFADLPGLYELIEKSEVDGYDVVITLSSIKKLTLKNVYKNSLLEEDFTFAALSEQETTFLEDNKAEIAGIVGGVLSTICLAAITYAYSFSFGKAGLKEKAATATAVVAVDIIANAPVAKAELMQPTDLNNFKPYFEEAAKENFDEITFAEVPAVDNNFNL